ncbi:MAG: cellulase family glycosylhydrolase [Lachnospiraceae bacterium]|nr:cellulase family glycosylhydrolase [Lachnospiraceae bacterium]
MNYTIDLNKRVEFNNKADHCIGTGRMDLALHKEYLDQLAIVQDEIGFSYIRGHGLFSKYMGIYREFGFRDMPKKEQISFMYLDMVMDSYLSLNIKPFLELGFMPDDMASGTETTFFWKGKISPPKDYSKWTNLVQITLRHLIDRYGIDEVRLWPVEIWNEPNLTSFWKDADMQEYFKLYEYTSKAVKEVDDKIRVGGPAICGVDDERWLKEFLVFVKEKNLPLDFVSRHHYTSYMPEIDGHYSYIDLHEPVNAFAWLERSRDIVDSFDEFKGKEIFITEFNTSYVPNAPIHDTVLNAAYVAHMLSRLGNKHDSYSYWTFGDVFEEMGVPSTPFYGGFGLVADGCIKKPTFYTFAFYKELKGDCVLKNEDCIVVKKEDGRLAGLIWNPDLYNEKKKLSIEFSVENMEDGEYFMLEKTVNEDHANPLKMWHEMGEPASMNNAQKELLRKAAEPGLDSSNVFVNGNKLSLKFDLEENELRFFEITKINRCSDDGYDYERVISQKCVPDSEGH